MALQNNLEKFPHEANVRVVLASRFGGAEEAVWPGEMGFGLGKSFWIDRGLRVEFVRGSSRADRERDLDWDWKRTRARSRGLVLCFGNEDLEDLIRRRYPKIRIHDDLKEKIHSWTSGHVGAIVALLELISKLVSATF